MKTNYEIINTENTNNTKWYGKCKTEECVLLLEHNNITTLSSIYWLFSLVLFLFKYPLQIKTSTWVFGEALFIIINKMKTVIGQIFYVTIQRKRSDRFDRRIEFQNPFAKWRKLWGIQRKEVMRHSKWELCLLFFFLLVL